ncbi:MAG TPA: hypothetical protein VIE37_08720 [Methylomirabilota bacterium]|jgi:hypothetical protein
MAGGRGGQKPWLTHTVFDVPLEAIRMPGRTPHGFVEQEAEVATGIARFIRGARY